MAPRRPALAFLALVAVLMTSPGAVALEAPAEASFPRRDVLFTRPGAEEHSDHVSRLRELLGQAAPGSSVRLAVYQFDLPELVEALGAARDRGVDVQVITTNHSAWTTWRLRRALNGPGDARRVFVFPGGFGHKNHNKFVVFSRIVAEGETVRDVVFATSANFTRASRDKHQNTLVLVDTALAEAYRTYWRDLRDAGLGRRDGRHYDRIAPGSQGDARVYFFPTDAGDTVADILGRVEVGADERPARVWVAMAKWRKTRMELADAMCALTRAGGDTRIVTREPRAGSRPSVDPEVLQRLRRCGVPVMTLPTSRVNLHSKYFLIDAPYRDARSDVRRRRIVWTGSPNFTGNGLRRNDEAMIEIEDPSIFDGYRGNFAELMQTWIALGGDGLPDVAGAPPAPTGSPGTPR